LDDELDGALTAVSQFSDVVLVQEDNAVEDLHRCSSRFPCPPASIRRRIETGSAKRVISGSMVTASEP
jgi:hypothetical protein